MLRFPLPWYALPLMAGAVTLVAFSGRTQEAQVTATPAIVQFSRIPEGAKPESIVRIINGGTTTIQIDQVSTSCGCTTSELSNKIIKAGQQATLKVRFDSVARLGTQEKMVTVQFVGGHSPLQIPLRADVYPLIRLSPAEINFKEVNLGQMKTATVNIERVDGGSLPTPRAFGTGENKVSVTRINSKRVALKVTMRPLHLTGVRQTNLRVATKISLLPALTIPIRAVAVGKYKVIPEEINFGIVRQRKLQRVVIRKEGFLSLGKLQVISTPQAVKATLSTSRDAHILTVECTSGKSQSVVNGKVILRADGTDGEIIQIPVTALLSD